MVTGSFIDHPYVNYTVTPEEWRHRIETTIIFTLLSCIGVILNVMVMLLTFDRKIRKNIIHILMAHLSVADLGFSLVFVFGQSQYQLNREQLPLIGCEIVALCTIGTALFGYFCPPILSLNRYISLYRPEIYEKVYTKRNISFMLFATWAICIGFPLIFFSNGKTSFDEDNLHCCIVVRDANVGWSILYWAIILPMVIVVNLPMLYWNYKIYEKLNEHKVTADYLKNNIVQQNKEMLYFLIADMIFPVIFHSTYHVGKLIHVYRNDIHEKRIFILLCVINPVFRGLITLTMLPPYRRAMKGLFGCQKQVTPATTEQVGSSRKGLAQQEP